MERTNLLQNVGPLLKTQIIIKNKSNRKLLKLLRTANTIVKKNHSDTSHRKSGSNALYFPLLFQLLSHIMGIVTWVLLAKSSLSNGIVMVINDLKRWKPISQFSAWGIGGNTYAAPSCTCV